MILLPQIVVCYTTNNYFLEKENSTHQIKSFCIYCYICLRAWMTIHIDLSFIPFTILPQWPKGSLIFSREGTFVKFHYITLCLLQCLTIVLEVIDCFDIIKSLDLELLESDFDFVDKLWKWCLSRSLYKLNTLFLQQKQMNM